MPLVATRKRRWGAMRFRASQTRVNAHCARGKERGVAHAPFPRGFSAGRGNASELQHPRAKYNRPLGLIVQNARTLWPQRMPKRALTPEHDNEQIQQRMGNGPVVPLTDYSQYLSTHL